MLRNSELRFSCCYLAIHNVNRDAITVQKDIPLEVDAGFLTVTDPNPIDADSYKLVFHNLSSYFSNISSAEPTWKTT